MNGAGRALITGVTGQDGWYLSRQLIQAGYQVSGLVHEGDDATVPSGVSAIAGDLRDADQVSAAVEQTDPDYIYNLGGISSVGLSWKQPLLTAEVTGLGPLRLIEAVRRQSERSGRQVRLVQASSAEIFGNAAAPQHEQTPIAPVTPYGAAKAFAHQLAAVYRASGVWVGTAILYNHESPRRPDTFVTRRITRQVAEIVRGLSDTLLIGNIDARRDWGYAGDYARALRLIAEHRVPDDFVIATGVSRTVADFIQAAFACQGITDWRSKVKLDPGFARPADPNEQRGDPAKARAELGWQSHTSFEQMVAEMVERDLELLDGAGS